MRLRIWLLRNGFTSSRSHFAHSSILHCWRFGWEIQDFSVWIEMATKLIKYLCCFPYVKCFPWVGLMHISLQLLPSLYSSCFPISTCTLLWVGHDITHSWSFLSWFHSFGKYLWGSSSGESTVLRNVSDTKIYEPWSLLLSTFKTNLSYSFSWDILSFPRVSEGSDSFLEAEPCLCSSLYIWIRKYSHNRYSAPSPEPPAP